MKNGSYNIALIGFGDIAKRYQCRCIDLPGSKNFLLVDIKTYSSKVISYE